MQGAIGSSWARATFVAAAIATGVMALSLLLLALESRYHSCVAAAEARYPAVAVSAFTTRSTGPVKVSFVEEREEAVEDCGRL